MRYAGIRIRKQQGGLSEGGLATRRFALVSNIWDWKAGRLVEWRREKAGTIEAVHGVVKNELAGGVLPSKYCGANAAWLRLAVITRNPCNTDLSSRTRRLRSPRSARHSRLTLR